jgi:hypothetical protein
MASSVTIVPGSATPYGIKFAASLDTGNFLLFQSVILAALPAGPLKALLSTTDPAVWTALLNDPRLLVSICDTGGTAFPGSILMHNANPPLDIFFLSAGVAFYMVMFRFVHTIDR